MFYDGSKERTDDVERKQDEEKNEKGLTGISSSFMFLVVPCTFSTLLFFAKTLLTKRKGMTVPETSLSVSANLFCQMECKVKTF